jgi:hypothetical protein
MALSMDVDYKGIRVNGAYIRVSMLTIYPQDKRMDFQLTYSVDSANVAFNTSGSACDYDSTKPDQIAQAYEHLKSRPEFASAIDC